MNEWIVYQLIVEALDVCMEAEIVYVSCSL